MPNHSYLLHGHCITSLPHTVVDKQDLSDPTCGCVTDVSQRAQLQAFLLNQFRPRWRCECLTPLREYHRTTGNNNQLVKSVDIVLVYDESLRTTWKLATVEELMAGERWIIYLFALQCRLSLH